MIPSPKYITLSDPSVPARERRLFWQEYGEAENPRIICCLHGLSRSSRDFIPLASQLGKQYRVICPDMAGRGESSWLDNPQDYNYGVYIRDMVALLQQLSISRLDWLGTSMGGIIGMMLAAAQPGLIRSLILNDIGATVSGAGLKRIMSYVGTGTVFADKDQAMQYLQKVLAPFGIRTPEQWEFMFQSSVQSNNAGGYRLRYDPAISIPLRMAMAEGTEITDIDLSSFWNAVSCPVLVLRGQYSDILEAATALFMQESKPDVTAVEFEKAGHAPALLEEIQIRTITDWLDRRG